MYFPSFVSGLTKGRCRIVVHYGGRRADAGQTRCHLLFGALLFGQLVEQHYLLLRTLRGSGFPLCKLTARRHGKRHQSRTVTRPWLKATNGGDPTQPGGILRLLRLFQVMTMTTVSYARKDRDQLRPTGSGTALSSLTLSRAVP